MLFGRYGAGKVDQFGSSYIATRFFRLGLIPIFPVGSFAVLGIRHGRAEEVAIPLVGRSVGLGYIRAVLAVATLYASCSLVGLHLDRPEYASRSTPMLPLVPVAVMLACGVVGLVASYRFGRLSGHNLQTHTIYHRATQIGLDPSCLGQHREVVRDVLLRRLAEKLRGAFPQGYRGVYADPLFQWPTIACDPAVFDPDLACDAFTLARLEWSQAPDQVSRDQWAAIHHTIWQKITRVHADLLPPYQKAGSTEAAGVLVALSLVGVVGSGYVGHAQASEDQVAAFARTLASAPLSASFTSEDGSVTTHHPEFLRAERENTSCVVLENDARRGEIKVGLMVCAESNPVSTDPVELVRRFVDGFNASQRLRSREAPVRGTVDGVESQTVRGTYAIDGQEESVIRHRAWVKHGRAFMVTIEVPTRGEARLLPLMQRIVDATRFDGPTPGANPCPADMALIPAGDFQMGSANGEEGSADNERPQHRVHASAFCMDRTEVTVAAYRRCRDAGGCPQAPSGFGNDSSGGNRFCNWGREGYELHPVNCVDWDQARAYCAWSGLVGGSRRLPTEAEWEYAARGTTGRRYAWGNALEAGRANFCGTECDNGIRRLADWTDAYPLTAPADSLPAGATPEGLLHMTGNVWEWVEDVYNPVAYGARPGDFNARVAVTQTDSANSDFRVFRGNGWSNYRSALGRAAVRDGLARSDRNGGVGFRCARNPS